MTINAVVHVNDTFAVELKGRCDRFRDELNHLVPVKNSVPPRIDPLTSKFVLLSDYKRDCL